MLAYGKPGEVREVELPGNDSDCRPLLPQVFEFGQNDVQPQQHPSVSVGDVIDLGNYESRFLVMPNGFYAMSAQQFDDYVTTPQGQRVMRAYALSRGG